VKERAHIKFDILLNALPKRAHGYVYVFAELATIVFACVALYYSMHTILQLLHFEGATPVLRVNKAWFEAAVPLGFILIVVRSLQAIRRDVSDLRAGREAYAGKALFEE
jgi:TRAP-type C4-dicarboxylate transport system permease small subunit